MKKIIIPIAILIALALTMGTAKAVIIWETNATKIGTGSTWGCTVTYGFSINLTGENINTTFELGRPSGTITNYTNNTASSPMVLNDTYRIFHINFTQGQLGPSGTYNFTWYFNDTPGKAWNSSDRWDYTVGKTTPVLRTALINDTYINFNKSFQVNVNITDDGCWDHYTNFTVKAYLNKSFDSKNFTLVQLETVMNLTYNFTKTDGLGEVSANASNITVTYIYIDGNENYTSTSNTTSLFCEYGTTNGITATAPIGATYNQAMTFLTNYSTTDADSLIDANCSVVWNTATHYMAYSSGYQRVTFTDDQTNTGTFGYVVTCSNSSYQTQTISGNIENSGGGGGGGGGGGVTTTVVTTTPAMIVTSVCGNGVCDPGEEIWNCWKDCNPFTGGATTTIPTEPGATTTIPTEEKPSTWTNPIVIIIAILVGIWLFKKL